MLIAMGWLLSHGSTLPELHLSSLPAGALPGVKTGGTDFSFTDHIGPLALRL